MIMFTTVTGEQAITLDDGLKPGILLLKGETNTP